LPDAFFNFLSLFKIKGLPIGAETKKGRKRAKEALYMRHSTTYTSSSITVARAQKKDVKRINCALFVFAAL